MLLPLFSMSSVTETIILALGKQGETLPRARKCRFISHPKCSRAKNRVGEVFVALTWLTGCGSRSASAASSKSALIVLYPLSPDQISLYGVDEPCFWEASSY